MKTKWGQTKKGFLRLTLVLSILAGLIATFGLYPELRSDFVADEVAPAYESFLASSIPSPEVLANIDESIKWIGLKLSVKAKLEREYIPTKSFRRTMTRVRILLFVLGFLLIWTIFLIIRFIIVPVVIFVIRGFKTHGDDSRGEFG